MKARCDVKAQPEMQDGCIVESERWRPTGYVYISDSMGWKCAIPLEDPSFTMWTMKHI